MMNALAIGLVLTSLLAAAVWSPSPSTHHVDDHREVIVKEGHRVVVVEYDKEADGSTKVLISPPETDEEKPASEGKFSGPRELVCDAYGKCKHKIASAFGKTKDKVEETAHGVGDKARGVEEHAKEAVNEAVGKVSQSEKLTRHKVGESLGKAKDTVAHGIDKAKEVAGDVAETVKDEALKVKNKLDVVASAKTLGGDIERNVTDKIEEGVKETVGSVHEVSEKSLGEILRKLKEVTNDVLWYVVSRDKVSAVVGLIHMLGYSTAYGMCVWVTFISSYILGRYLPKQQFGIVQSRIYPVYFKAMAYCISAALLGHLASRKEDSLSGMIGDQGLSLLSALLMVLTNLFVLDPRATKTMYEKMKIEKEEGRGVERPTREGITDPNGLADRAGATATAVRSGPASATVARPGTAGTTYRDMLVDNAAPTVERPVVADRQDFLRLNQKLKRLNTYSSVLNTLTLVALTWHMAYMGQRLHAAR